jgi:phosphatidylglycerophosphate synthase
VPTVRMSALVGLVAQITLLTALATTVGLGPAAWAAGVAYGVIMCVLLAWGQHRLGTSTGPADWVTLTRATLVGGVAALTVDAFDGGPSAVLVGIAVVALVLDALDGQVARRTGTTSALGARFDMEVDAFLILVLSVYTTRLVGAWVLAIGAMRYAFVAAGWALPWLRRRVPPRYWRRVVAATQGIVLVFAAADVLPRPLVEAALIVALALLIESFGRDVLWLWRHRAVEPPVMIPRPASLAGRTDG